MAAKDLTGVHKVRFDLRSNRTGANLKFGLHNLGVSSTGSPTITTDGLYTVYKFTGSGTFTPAINGNFIILVVAGGGGGGAGNASGYEAGGGGAGGLVYHSSKALTGGTQYTVTIGSGGASITAGSNSVFGDITALGGGYGASGAGTGGAGGSGGGGAHSTTNAGTSTQGTSGGGAGYGFAGKKPDAASHGGGGGGAGEAGDTDGIAYGGDGRAYDILIASTNVYYAGGGAGSHPATAATGGEGGGGSTTGATGVGGAGTANTGGGGGGGYGNGQAGGSGGSGIVIVRYLTSSQPTDITTEITPCIATADTFQEVNINLCNVVPVMTSNTAPSGVASASDIWNTGYDAWKAFDKITKDADNNCWHSGNGAGAPSDFPHWLQYQFTSAKIVTRYAITARLTYATWPTDWTFRGSNNGTDWTTLDTQSGQVFTLGQRIEFPITNTTAYAYYRINITAGTAAQNCGIAELELTVPGDSSMDSIKNNIDYFTITVIDTGAANTFYIDNFRTLTDNTKSFTDDSFSVTEPSIKKAPARSFSVETMTISEVSMRRGITRPVLEVFNITDLLVLLRGLIFYDTANLTESYSRRWTLSKVWSEITTLTEIAAKDVIWVISETATLIDTLVRSWSIPRLFTEEINLSDIFLYPLKWLRESHIGTTWAKASKTTTAWGKSVKSSTVWIKTTETLSAWSRLTKPSNTWQKKTKS